MPDPNALCHWQGYKVILAERRGTLSEQCNKLRNGLTKLEEAREQARRHACGRLK